MPSKKKAKTKKRSHAKKQPEAKLTIETFTPQVVKTMPPSKQWQDGFEHGTRSADARIDRMFTDLKEAQGQRDHAQHEREGLLDLIAIAHEHRVGYESKVSV